MLAERKQDMAELIASLAFFISIMSLIMHYRNQLERRHGKITKLRSDLIQRLSGTRRSLMSVKIHIEMARLELRRMNECDDKYNTIEIVPRLIEKNQDLIRKIDKVLGGLNELDTAKMNKSKVLMALQSGEHEVRNVENLSSEVEKDVLGFLISIRSKQEYASNQRAEQLDKAQPTNSADPKGRAAD